MSQPEPEDGVSQQFTPADFWGLSCPGCNTNIPFSNPEETDLDSALENWCCPECGHQETPHLALEDPEPDAEAEADRFYGQYHEHPCSECNESILVFGTQSKLDGATTTCDECGTEVTIHESDLSEANLGFDTISKSDLHIWRTEDRSGISGGFHVVYGDKAETKRHLRDKHLRNQHGHGPLGALKPGRDYDDVEYLGTLKELTETTHEEPLITNPGLPTLPNILSEEARLELKSDLAEFVTGAVRIACSDCERTVIAFGPLELPDSVTCPVCDGASVVVNDERRSNRPSDE